MSTLSEIVAAIDDILQDPAYTEAKIVSRINASLQTVAAGVRMPNGEVSPPLPDLYAWGTVSTSTTLPYVSLPANYQRKVFRLFDSSNNIFSTPRGGDFYSFARFMQGVSNFNLAETGSIYAVAIKGSRLYYQGIPTASTSIGLHYFRKPATLALDGDVPEGIPEHLAQDLLKHAVIKEIYGEIIEAGVSEPSRGMQYHTSKYFEVLTALCDAIGIDGEPQYYGSGDSVDMGVCD
jgi:hypothetical protein